jgi:Tfp pilus assembly protein FimT
LGVSVMVISRLCGLIPAWASTRVNSSAIRVRLAASVRQLRGEAVAGTVPAGHVEAQGQDGHGGGASVWHVEVAGFHAVRDELADDLADLTLVGRDVG